MNFVRRLAGKRLHSPHTLPEDLSKYRERVAAGSRTGYIRRLEILRRYDIRERLERVVTPTLFLASDRDHVVPAVSEARYMAARMPRATVRILEGHGHVCLINHELDLLEEITSWIDGGERQERSALKRAADPPSA
jgi:pimeloyl-ACP methyl ester carboxylesterase